jgi:glycosyltransferase involved in cell wall biosynthesis
MNQTPNTRPFRLGIDGDALKAPLSGVGHYVFNIARELELLFPRAELFAYSRLDAAALRLPSDRWTVRQEPRRQLRRLPSFLWLKTRGRQLAQRDALDVFWAGRTIHPGLPKPTQTLVTVHDLNHRIVPQTMQASTRLSHALWFERDVRSATLVVANSAGTASRLDSTLGVKAGAICLPGLDPRFRLPSNSERDQSRAQLAALGIRPPYYLCVATLEPRKNVDRVLSAFLTLTARGELRGHQLVIAGARGWSNTSLYQRLEAARDRGVVLTGYVADELMPGLYSEANALLFPSTYEGFGMPVLEARACGTPAVISCIPELLEAAASDAHAIDPTTEQIARAMLRLEDNTQRHVTPVDQGTCGWDHSALSMARAIEEMLG